MYLSDSILIKIRVPTWYISGEVLFSFHQDLRKTFGEIESGISQRITVNYYMDTVNELVFTVYISKSIEDSYFFNEHGDPI